MQLGSTGALRAVILLGCLTALAAGLWGCPGSPLADRIAASRAQNDNGGEPSPDGDTQNGDMTEETPVPVPTIISFNVQNGAVNLQWAILDPIAAETVSSYVVQRSEQPATGFETATRVIARFDQPPFVDADVVPGTTYYYRVIAIGLAGDEGEPSDVVQITAPATDGHVFVNGSDVIGEIDIDILGVSDLNGGDPDFAGESVQNIIRAMGSQWWRVGMTRWDPGDVLGTEAILEREIFFGTTLEDANNPAFYNFSYLDRVIQLVIAGGASPVVTFDAMPHSIARNTEPQFRTPVLLWSDDVRNSPPADAEILAEVVTHVISHYRRGWANGMQLDLQYWEFWHAPDLNRSADGSDGVFWTGTLDEFAAVYAVAHRAVKEEFGDEVRFGGAAFVKPVSVGRFLDGLQALGVTPDFVSYQVYEDQLASFSEFAESVHNAIAERGLDNVETIVSGWNLDLPVLGMSSEDDFFLPQAKFDTTFHAVRYLAAFQTFNDLEVTMALHEGLRDRPTGLNLGLLTSAYLNKPVTRLLEAMQVYRRRHDRLRLGPESAIGLAGIDEERTALTLMVVNPLTDMVPYSISIDDLPWEDDVSYHWTLTVLDDTTVGITGGFAGDITGGGRGTRLRITDVPLPGEAVLRLEVARD